MENKIINGQSTERKDRNLILFDNGFTELQCKEKKPKKKENENTPKKNNINWFTFYIVLFKNTLGSKHLVPTEELKLRLNIIRQYLPPFYNCQKYIEDSNSKSIIKKFTYHLYSKNNSIKKMIERKNQNILNFDDDNENEENNTNIDVNQIIRRPSKTRTQSQSFSKFNLHFLNDKNNVKKNYPQHISQKLKIIQEFDKPQEKQTPQTKPNLKSSCISGVSGWDGKTSSSPKKPNSKHLDIEKNVKIRFSKKNVELNSLDNNKDIVIRTPNDNEFPLILTDKRMMNSNNNNQTFFIDCLNKLNEETKNIKINSYKKEVTSQILKFNDIFFDTKIDDLSQDHLFNEIKNTCDIFINKFNFDNQEEKNLGDLDKFI